MKRVTARDLMKLIRVKDTLCLTVYTRKLSDFPDHIDEARRLAAADGKSAELEALINRAMDFVRTRMFYDPEGYYALFVSKRTLAYSRLPFLPESVVVVSNSFHVKPIIKWKQRDYDFAVLEAFGAKYRWYQGTPTELDEQDISASEMRKKLRKCRKARIPVVAIGSYSTLEGFRNGWKRRSLFDQEVMRLTPCESIHEVKLIAVKALEPIFQRIEERQLAAYWTAKIDNRTCENFAEIARFALLGNIQHLFISEGTRIWGVIDRERMKVRYHSKQQNTQDDDLLDDLAELVIAGGGEVTVLPWNRMPHQRAAVAVTRRDTEFRPAKLLDLFKNPLPSPADRALAM